MSAHFVARIARAVLAVLIAAMVIRPAMGQRMVPSAGAVAESTLDARTRAIAAQLRCPVCQGLSLQDSPSELAQQMRDVVRQQLAAGATEADVKRYFVGRYGEWILMSPEPHGFNWLVYLLPLAALIAGVALLVRAVRRWTTSAPAWEKSAHSPTPL